MDGQSTAERARLGALERGGLDHEQLAAQYGWVRSVARNLVRDPWGAEDVTQETLLAALAAPPPDVPDDQRLRAWLGRVAFNLSRLGVRQGARRRAREVRVARAEAMPSVSDELEARATVNGLSRAIAELSEPDRRVVLMRYFDGHSTAEIAAHLGVSELAVRKRLWRARNKLRVALEPERRSGQFLAFLCARIWNESALPAPARGAGWSKALSGLAASLAVCAGATWWWGTAPRGAELAVASVAQLDPDARTVLEPGLSGVQPTPARPLGGPEALPSRRSWVPPLPRIPPSEPSEQEEEELVSALDAEGFVLDLDGRAQPGLEVLAAASLVPADGSPGASAPGRAVLATTDALGGFRIPAQDLPGRTDAPLVLEARGADLTTVVRARLTAGQRQPGLILVAAALDLAGRVLDEDGVALDAAHLELRCDATAFARIEHPLRLDSAVLCAFGTDVAGRFERAALPRAAGLSLHIECPGYEPLERATLELGREELFVLRPTPVVAELSGTVYRQDGRMAAGATVRLARASTTTDTEGRFRLPLRGVRADSPLEASDKNASPTRVPDFGSRFLAGQVGSVDIVLGEEFDLVEGQLVGPSSVGWLVAAYPEQGVTLDEKGREVPSALAHSDAAGGFSFSLPSGRYSLRALAPDAIQVARRDGLDSRSGAWELELPARTGLASLNGTVHSDEGQLLAGARVAVAVLVDGASGRRSLPWGHVASGSLGDFAFPRDPELAVELAVEADETTSAQTSDSTSQGFSGGLFVAALQARAALVAQRPAWLQVTRSGTAAEACSLLDADGTVLASRGPLGSAASFGLREGWSPVLAVPSSVRWLELRGPGAEPLRVPIQPQPGRLLKVSP